MGKETQNVFYKTSALIYIYIYIYIYIPLISVKFYTNYFIVLKVYKNTFLLDIHPSRYSLKGLCIY